MSDERESLVAARPPLDAEGVLWVAAIDRVPIRERIEWVKTMLARVEQINAGRAAGGQCRARRVHPLSSDYYIRCTLEAGHDHDHTLNGEVLWADDSAYALPEAGE